MRRRAGLLAGLLAFSVLLACGPEPAPAPERARDPAASVDVVAAPLDEAADPSSRLAGAALVAGYDTDAIARIARALPRPSSTGSPLVDAFAGIVESLRGEPFARLAAIGLSRGERVELSLRPLDDRRAAVRKRITDLAALAPERRSPEALAELHEQAASLGVHVRASLPSSDPERLAAVLATIVGSSAEDPWRGVCASLGEPRSCGGRERLLVWTRPTKGGLRVDALYLFHAPPQGSTRTWLLEVAQRADAMLGEAEANPTKSDEAQAALALRLDVRATLALVQAELTADSALALVRGELDEHALLDRERALDDLLVTDRLFEGIDLRGSLGEGEDPELAFELRWTPAPGAEARLAALAEPSPLVMPAPARAPLCAEALACMRLDALARIPRFAELASGAYADSTTIQRVLRQAGDRGWLLVQLATWPNLLGTLGTMAQSGGITGRAANSLASESAGLGGALLELGPAAGDEQWVGWLRAKTSLIELVEPLAGLAGVKLDPVEIAGQPGMSGEGTIADQPMQITTLHEGADAWLIAADDAARIPWLLGHPRDPTEQSIFYMQARELGRIGVRGEFDYTDDPPVQRWLQTRELEIEGVFRASEPLVRISLRPRQP